VSRALNRTLFGFALLGAAVLGAYLYEHLAGAGRAAPGPTLALHPPAAAAAAMVPDAVPAHRPQFALADLEGRVHSVSEWDGKSLVVNFWATWCAPCRHEIPLLNHIQQEYGPKGFEVVGIAVDVAKDVKAFTAEVPLQYPLLVGEQDGIDAAQAFGVNALAFPFTAFTDAKGRMITLHLGELHEATARAILGIISRVNAGELTPDGAREEVRRAVATLDRPAS